MLKELILICYLLCIILCVSGLTIAMLVNRKNKKGISKNLAFFLMGILVICCYDMAIYYSDYVLGIFSNLKVLRIGSCLIAGTLYLWTDLQDRIIKREALSMLDKLVKRYQLFYMVLWLVLTFTMSIEQFYAFKWLLLATDIMLIIASITVCVGHIIYASTAGKKEALYHQCDHDGDLELYFLFLGRNICILGQQQVYQGTAGSYGRALAGYQPCDHVLRV